MKKSFWSEILPVLCLCLFLSTGAVAGQKRSEKEAITVEWIYGPEGRRAVALPFIRWLADGTLLIYDPGRPEAERALERLDPETGWRQALFEVKQALARLRNIVGKEKCPARLTVPAALDKEEMQAVYHFDSDLFLLKLKTGTFTRLTENKEAEQGTVFSPSGKRIAYVRQHDIFVMDLDTRRESRLTRDGADHLFNGELSYMYGEDVFLGRQAGIWWAPGSGKLAFLQTDLSPVGKIYYKDFRPYFPRIIEQHYPVTGGAIERVRLGIVSLENTEEALRWVDLDMERDRFAYLVHVDWLPGGRQLAVQTLNRAQDELILYFVDSATGRVRRIFTERDEAWVNVLDDIYFLKEREQFIWGSERTGYKHLYRYDLNGRLLNSVTSGNWAVRGPFQLSFWAGKAVTHIDEKRRRLYFTGLKKSALERHLYSIGLNGRGLRRITKEDGFHAVTFSPDGRYYLDFFSTIVKPPVVSLHRRSGERVKVVAEIGRGLKERFDLRLPEQFFIPARDGFSLPAQLWKPRNFDPIKKYPVVVHHYGGPQAPEVLNFWNRYTFYNQVLLNKGFLVFSVDTRSATAVSHTLEKTVFQKMHTGEEIADLLDGIRWLKSRPFVDPERVGIWGWSYGGCSTLVAMTHSMEFKAGIAVAAVSDMRHHSPKWSEFGMKMPKDYPEVYERASLVKRAGDLHGRLLLVHGTYDDNVRIQNLWAFVDALVRAGKNFDMMIYPMRKHGISDPPARIHLFNKMVEFWTHYL